MQAATNWEDLFGVYIPSVGEIWPWPFQHDLINSKTGFSYPGQLLSFIIEW